MRVRYILNTINNGHSAASINRVNLLIKGLCENYIDSENIGANFSNNKYINRLIYIYSIIRICILSLFSTSNDFFIIYGESFRYLRLFILINKIKKVKYIVERNEYSSYLLRNTDSKESVKYMKKFESNIINVNGFITCSTYLGKYYQQYLSLNTRISILPLVVDTKLFKINDSIPEKYIAYCGDFGGNKDGVPILLNAFNIIASKYKDYKLYLIGDTTDKNAQVEIYNTVNESQYKDRIIFTGRVSHDKMPELLGKASLLTLARPNNKQAEGGIPSKLAEYMATGRPTLITRVGDLPKYFTDKKDIFFAEPDSIDDFAQKIDFILSNYDDAKLVGLQGAKTIQQFDYRLQSKKLIKFLKEIK